MDAPNPNLNITYKVKGGRGTIQVLVRWDGGSFTDQFDVLNALSRARFVKRLVGSHGQIDPVVVTGELDRIAEELAARTMDDEAGDEFGGSDDEILIQIGRDEKNVELFRSGADDSAEAFARIRKNGFCVHYGVRSRAFGMWLRSQFFQFLDRSPTAEAFTSAINTLEAAALNLGERVDVYLRVALTADGIAIDLCDEEWRVVLVTASGWRVTSSEDSPVRFTRRRGMFALPVPQPGGSIEELRPFVNLPSQDGWVLFACTLTSAYRPRGPHVVLTFSGEQGSAKSTTMKRGRSLIDPNQAPVRRMPKEDRDMMIAAKNGHLQAFDNLSHISPQMSDALCSLTTGGGYATRQLYTDDEEALFDAVRPVFMNGIEDVATRPDLLDRCVVLALPPISEVGRREEKDMDAAFEKARPRILGALLDGVSTALRRLDAVKLTRRPRMADYARWCIAAETGLGFPEGSFAAAYERNRKEAVSIALESSAIYPALNLLMAGNKEWTGTALELLRILESLITDGRTKDRRDWPSSGKGMAEALKRIAPALRSMGIEVVTGERTNDKARQRLITLRRTPSDDSDDQDDDFRPPGGRKTGGEQGQEAVHSFSDPLKGGKTSSEPSESSDEGVTGTASSEPSDDDSEVL